MSEPAWVLERQRMSQEYYEYLRGIWEYNCELAGIQPPIWMLSVTAHGNGVVTYRVGNGPPGPAIDLTFQPGELLPPPFGP